MLVLTRRAGEALRIADCISLMILRVDGNQVRIGVNASKDIEVHREEVYLRLAESRPDMNKLISSKK